jgi:molybdopterin synthase catalytic subunit
MAQFRLSDSEIDPQAERERLAQHGAGGFVSFEGWVRDNSHGRAVLRLDYQAYAKLALTEGERIVAAAIARHGALDAACVHRTGRLELGGLAVWVGACAAHRDAAFATARDIIDAIKRDVPIWKREHFADGVTDWIHPEA